MADPVATMLRARASNYLRTVGEHQMSVVEYEKQIQEMKNRIHEIEQEAAALLAAADKLEATNG